MPVDPSAFSERRIARGPASLCDAVYGFAQQLAEPAQVAEAMLS